MRPGLRRAPVPALLNGPTLALRPVVTQRDHAQASAFAEALPLSRAAPAAAYLIEDKRPGTLLGLACVMRRSPRSPGPEVDCAFAEGTDIDAIRPELATLLSLRSVDARLHDHADALLAEACSERIGHWSATFVVPDDYADRHHLAPIPEPSRLAYAGRDYVGRSLWLTRTTCDAWQAMQRDAAGSGIRLEAVSGFRNIEYQAGIWRRKRDRGLSTAEILAINVPPGFSEHHSGRALDITTPGCGAAEPEFAGTAAFAWLERHAHRFGFTMSFPEGNRHGVMYEPWHWCHHD